MRTRLALLTAIVLLGLVPAARGREPSPAQEFHQSILAAVDGIAADVPRMRSSAEQAAQLFVEQDFPIAAAGDAPFVSEALGRSGGLMSLVTLPADPSFKGIVLYALDERRFDADLPRLAQLHAAGAYVVAFARSDEAEAATARGAALDAVIENHASKQSAAPADGIADIAAMWTWTGEFAAACTRLGKMPTFYLGYVNPGGREREARIGKVKFHAETVPPIKAGALGAQYLLQLKQYLANLEAELPKIRQAAAAADAARDAGKQLHLVTVGHAMAPLLDAEPQAAGGFVNLVPAETLASEPQAGDFVLLVGYSFLPDDPAWSHLLEVLQRSPATVVWSMAGYQPEEIAKIPADDLYIEQHWTAPDADVVVPGYDIKIIPTSGAIAETVFWMIVSEMGD